jgi:endonuclease/exonuclease/phosphatase family metal-dependent hydrolase
VKIVTYNIHKARGMDGRTNINRIAKVLSEVNADIIALQEVFSTDESTRPGQLEAIATALDMHAAFGCTRQHLGKPYGNAILSRWPIVASYHMDISHGKREDRGCIRADLKTPRGPLHVFNIHLGTRYFERKVQVRHFLSARHIQEDLLGPRVIVGDFNEWIKGPATRVLSEKFESLNMELHVSRKRTYPGFLPLLHLDHIYFERPLHIESAELVRTRLSKVASDHLPLSATFAWDETSE